MNPICLFRGLWRSLVCGAVVSGHDFETDKQPTPPNIHALRCRTCGSVSVAWSWNSLENVK